MGYGIGPMPPSTFTCDLPEESRRFVLREDGKPRQAMEQIVSSKNDPGNGCLKTPLYFLHHQRGLVQPLFPSPEAEAA